MNHPRAPAASTFSKWLSLQVLLDPQEMEALLTELGEIYLFSIGVIYPAGKGEVSKEEFLASYTYYVESLKKGIIPEENSYRNFFSLIFTQNKDHVFPFLLEDGRQLMRLSKPVVQLQQHRLDYSRADGKFYPMIFGQESILWGLQFAYPQLYQDGVSKEIVKITASPELPNTQLFRKIQLWIRHHTVPIPFIVEGKKINVPMRVGKKCLSWINHHPQLLLKNIQVQTFEN